MIFCASFSHCAMVTSGVFTQPSNERQKVIASSILI
ncbi:hypothetical protein ebA6090 [Aromatoleum aromaticum EbN1]|uniref:Uncharacterized protein n=1 Tax=Aromatoleum aromaticum (strain DSM 19018 / LMG 30748 / EbN1) TaxID=76114 RepID=Q5NZB3_AROAE|nr:hypothetical protein ebA6090 [Aromatoleum aromaticum EbN1]